MLQKCTCGSRKFKAAITLELQGVPVKMLADGSIEYDDTKAEYTDGWDTAAQPEIACAACEKLYHLEPLEGETDDDRPTYELTPMDAPAAPGRDEEDG